MNKLPIILILMVSLVVIAGCAKSDWIQSTLVKVDVTGTWVGSSNWPSGSSTSSFEVRFELEQQGPTVSGLFRALGPGALAAMWPDAPLRAIEGTVAGDALTFRRTDEQVTGEATVIGDEMSVRLHGTGTAVAESRAPIILRRVNSSAPPRSP